MSGTSDEPRVVRLTVPEVQYGMALATQRDACKPDRDSRLSTRLSGFGVHFAGVIGELCFRKVYGGKLNLSILPSGDNHVPDVVLSDGREVEVKTSLFQGRDVELKMEKDEMGTSPFYALVQVTLPDIGRVFPVWSWEYLEPLLTLKDYKYGDRYVYAPLQQTA